MHITTTTSKIALTNRNSKSVTGIKSSSSSSSCKKYARVCLKCVCAAYAKV